MDLRDILSRVKWFTLVFLCNPAFAFDLEPEYQGLSEADLLKFETPLEVDSEYQTIINAYSYSVDWERDWHKSSRAVDLSVGSMSNKLFHNYGRVKLQSPLTESLNFHFTAFSQRDREVDQVRHILELSQKLSQQLRVNIYGEPSMYKRENDLGLALLWTHDNGWQHRLYYTLHDLTRAEHNDQADKFDSGHDPRSMGWNLAGESGRLWMRAGFRYDQPVRWVRPQEARIFSFEKKLVYADARWDLLNHRRLTSRLQWDETFKGQVKDSVASTVIDENWRLTRWFVRFSFIQGEAEDLLGFEAAVMHAQRGWKSLTGELSHFNELASLALNVRGVRRGEFFDHWRIEYEMGIFRRFGDLYLAPTQKDAPAEHRLLTAYEWSFLNNAKLRLALNFDADQWSPVPTFEGGQGSFRIDF